MIKFEREFIDEDAEEDESKKKPQGPQAVVQVSTANMSPVDKVTNSITLVQTNLKGAQAALERSNQGIEEMKNFMKTQKGMAKKQLQTVLDTKRTYADKLIQHIKEGEQYLH